MRFWGSAFKGVVHVFWLSVLTFFAISAYMKFRLQNVVNCRVTSDHGQSTGQLA